MAESQKSYYVKSGLFSFFEKGSIFIFGFFGFVILARALSEYDYGVWVIYMTVTTMAEISVVGMIQNTLVKYLATARGEDYGRVIVAAGTLQLVMTIIFSGVLFFLAPLLADYWSMPHLTTMIRLYCLIIFLLIPFYLLNFIQQANLDFQGIFWSNFARKFIFFVYVLFMFIAGSKIEITNLVLVQIVGAVLGSLIAFKFGGKYLKLTTVILDRKWLNTLFHYGKFVFGTNLSTMGYKSVDKFMLASFIDPIAVALYDNAIKITNLVDVPALTVASVVFPQGAIQSDGDNRKAIKELYEKSVGATLAIIVPFIAVVMLFPDWILWIISGDKYLDAAPILQLTVLYGLFLPFAIQFGTILDSIGKPKINFIFTCIGMLINVVLNYVFIKVLGLGIAGAAYGTLLTYAIAFTMYQIVLNRMFGVQAFRAFYHIPGFYKQGWEIGSGFLKKNKTSVQ